MQSKLIVFYIYFSTFGEYNISILRRRKRE
nr:MAG TPA: hypothetical protein [Caudoviricetes sp.]